MKIEYTYITRYPVILKSCILAQNEENTAKKEMLVPPFFIFAASCYRSGNNIHELNFCILIILYKAFASTLKVKSWKQCLFNFKCYYKITNLFDSDPILEKNNTIKDDYYDQLWMSIDKIASDTSKIFIQTLEASSIEMLTLFNAKNNTKVFEKYVT
jgi:hypothetical protein